GDARVGQTLFNQKLCLRCHQVGGEGGSTGPALDTIPRGISPLRLAQALWNHRPAMVAAIESSGLAVPTFDGKEILDLFAYVRSQGRRESGEHFESLGNPAQGRAVLDSKGCSLCHEFFGDGTGVGPDLGRMELREGVTQIAGRMWNHWPAMARQMEQATMPVPQFQADELVDLFAYLYLARYRGEPGEAARGAAVYEEKGCVICHGAGGRGGTVEVDLRTATQSQSRERIMQTMWNHAPKMGGLLRDQHLSWPRLSALEITDLLEFLSNGWSPAEGAPGSN
ncbi:MAG TPA: c-type cytochrome, partial [Candidatus Polarisedimenticolia bacterium]|nr:c-type cytochrome [Candidatus Polarisedimenticolia bacterium]